MTKLKQLLDAHAKVISEGKALLGKHVQDAVLAEIEQAIEDYVGQAMIDAMVYGKRAARMTEDEKMDEWDRIVGKWATL